MSSQPASFTSKRALGEASRDNQGKKRVVVTGGSGKLGRATVKHLAESGYEVINLDRVRPKGASEDGKSGTPAYRIVEIDLENYGEVIDALNEIDMGYKGVEAVVHLAAIPSPGQVAASKQFRVNTMSTYNILEACRKLGITNIVLASSETLIGIPFDPHPPNALPITEDEPRKPESSYSLSKLVGEVIAEEHCRWNPNTLKIVSLRFSNVMLEEEYASFEDWQNDPSLRYWNAWGYIDARDGAQAIRKALESQKKGHHQYLIANSNTCMRKPNDELVKACFPNVKYTPTSGKNDTLLSIEKARRELGYEPEYNWK